jgi:hypothetical protein
MAGDTEKPGELAGLNPTSTAADLELAEGLSIFRNFRSEVHRVLAPNLDVLVHQPSWGLLQAMYNRALAHVEGCFVLFSHKYYSCAEALCRTAVEASINLYYSSLG